MSKCDRIYEKCLTAIASFFWLKISYGDGLWVTLKQASNSRGVRSHFLQFLIGMLIVCVFALRMIIMNRSIDLTKKKREKQEEEE